MEREIVYSVVDCRRDTPTFGLFKTMEGAEKEMDIQVKRIMDIEMEGNPSKLPVERKGDVVLFNGMRLVAIYSYVLRD